MKRLKWITLGALLALVSVLVMGCGKVTVESLFQENNKNLKDVESVDMDILVNMEYQVEAESATTSMEVAMDVNAKAENEKGLCIDGSATINMFGTEMNVPMKSYMVMGEEENTTYTYDPNSDSWTYAKADVEKEDITTDIVKYDYSKLSDKLTLESELEEYQDQDCYRVHGEVEGAELADLIENIEEELQQYELSEDALEYLTVDISFYFNAKTKDLAGIYFDFSGSDWEKLLENSDSSDELGLNSMLGEGAKVNVPTLDMEIIVNGYDDYKFELPEDIRDQAVEDESKSENVMMDLGEDADTEDDTDSTIQSKEDAVLDDDLDVAKGKFQIERKTYRLGEAVSVLEEDGWEFDSEYNDSDMIEAESEDFVYFSKDGKLVSVYVQNQDSEEKSYKECIISGIYHSNTDDAAAELDGGIKLGSSYEEVIAVFGEPVDTYESENYQFLDYVTESGEIAMEISFTDKVVTGIMLVYN